MKKKGVNFIFNDRGLKVSSEKFDSLPFEISCGEFPDLVPSLVFLMCLCNGKSTLRNLEVLTYKESDRFYEIINILKSFDIPHEFDPKKFTLSIIGPVNFHINKDVNLPPDHRMIMLASMLLKKFGAGEINNYEHVVKSYSNFFKDFKVF